MLISARGVPEMPDLRQEATEEARAKGHLLGGWTPHRLGWGAFCLHCGLFILVAHRVYGLASAQLCEGRQ
jgi:hypothetical protein